MSHLPNPINCLDDNILCIILNTLTHQHYRLAFETRFNYRASNVLSCLSLGYDTARPYYNGLATVSNESFTYVAWQYLNPYADSVPTRVYSNNANAFYNGDYIINSLNLANCIAFSHTHPGQQVISCQEQTNFCFRFNSAPSAVVTIQNITQKGLHGYSILECQDTMAMPVPLLPDSGHYFSQDFSSPGNLSDIDAITMADSFSPRFCDIRGCNESRQYLDDLIKCFNKAPIPKPPEPEGGLSTAEMVILVVILIMVVGALGLGLYTKHYGWPQCRLFNPEGGHRGSRASRSTRSSQDSHTTATSSIHSNDSRQVVNSDSEDDNSAGSNEPLMNQADQQQYGAV